MPLLNAKAKKKKTAGVHTHDKIFVVTKFGVWNWWNYDNREKLLGFLFVHCYFFLLLGLGLEFPCSFAQRQNGWQPRPLKKMTNFDIFVLSLRAVCCYCCCVCLFVIPRFRTSPFCWRKRTNINQWYDCPHLTLWPLCAPRCSCYLTSCFFHRSNPLIWP